MNLFIRQMSFVEKSILELFTAVDTTCWKDNNGSNCRSIFELCQHIANIPKADLMLARSISHQEIDSYYQQHEFQTMEEMKSYFIVHMAALNSYMVHMDEVERQRLSISYWGAKYTQEEWILEILLHLVHHRAQLHFSLKRSNVIVDEVNLFE